MSESSDSASERSTTRPNASFSSPVDSSADAYPSLSKTLSPKDAALLESEVASLSQLISSVSNTAALTATRQHWRKCALEGKRNDDSFLVRAILKHSTDNVLDRTLRDYQKRFLAVATAEFLDRAMEQRFMTIGAKELVALLARSGRLGYDEADAVDEDEGVMPTVTVQRDDSESDVQEISRDQVPPQAQQQQPDPLLEQQRLNTTAAAAAAMASAAASSFVPPVYHHHHNQSRNRIAHIPGRSKFFCEDCGQSFTQAGGLKYHLERRVCHKAPLSIPANGWKFQCDLCGRGFTTRGGELYHKQNKVCESHETAIATTPNPWFEDAIDMLRETAAPGSLESYARTHVRPQHPSQRQSVPAVPVAETRFVAHTYPDFGNAKSSRDSTGSTNSQGTPISSSQLDPITLNEMNAKLAKEQARYDRELKALPENITAAEREERASRMRKGHASRKCQIRRGYGVAVRRVKGGPASSTPEASDKVMNDTHSVPSFAPINRFSTFQAQPTPTVPSHPRIHSHPNSPLDGPDSKRRKYNTHHAPSDSGTVSTIDSQGKYFSSNVAGRAAAIERQNGIIAQNRQSIGATTEPPAHTSRRLSNPNLGRVEVDPEIAARAVAILDRSRAVSSSTDGLQQHDEETSTDADRLKREEPVATAQKQLEGQRALSSTPSSQTATGRPAMAPTRKAAAPIAIMSDDENGNHSHSDIEEVIPARKPLPSSGRTLSPQLSRRTRTDSFSPANMRPGVTA